MNDLEALGEWLSPLLAKLSSQQRQALMRELSQFMRQQNQARIKNQTEPDGSRFAPRKQQLRKTGTIKRGAMFSRLRLNRLMRIEATANGAAVFWPGRTGRIAEAHHYGQNETIKQLRYSYPARQLLGLTPAEQDELLDKVLAHLQ